MTKLPHVMMLVAHEPELDPRIHWEAQTAASRFAVTVIGVSMNGTGPSRTGDAPVQYHRMCVLASRSDTVPLVRELAALIFASWRDLLRPRLLFVTVAAFPLAVAGFMAVVAVQILRAFVRILDRLARYSHAIRDTSGIDDHQAATPGTVRRRLGDFYYSRSQNVHMLLGLFRHFFAVTRSLLPHIHNEPHRTTVLHCNDLDTLLAGVLAKRKYGIPVVYDAHEYFPFQFVGVPRYLSFALEAYEECLIRRVDRVVTVSPLLARQLERSYGIRHVETVPNAELTYDSPPSALLTPMTRLAGGRLRFLYQGRFAPGRGLEEIIEWWRDVDARRAALFLRGPDNDSRRACKELAGRYGVLDRCVYFLDPVEEDQLVAACREADVGVIPYKPDVLNYRYACPNKLSQYLHAGLAVLTNSIPFVQQVIEDSGAGVRYDGTRPESFVAAVQQLIGNPDAVAMMRRRALDYARTTFNWHVQGGVFLDLYQDLSRA